MHLFSALPSVEERKRELDILKTLFEGFGEKIPIIINLDETTDDADAERATEWSRLAFIFCAGVFLMSAFWVVILWYVLNYSIQ
jgi:uncharacterized membrane protein